MKRTIKTLALAGSLAALAGCDGWLTGEGLTIDPNFPTQEPNAEQLVISQQVRLFINQEGQAARTAAIWTQQLAGINNQQRDYGSRYQYATHELDTNTAFNNVYFGLRDLRLLQRTAADEAIPLYEAMGMFMEAFTIGTATSVWGDLPYREVIEVDGVRIGVTHPAWAGLEPEPADLLPDFPESEVGRLDAICYGHIHTPLNEDVDGVRFVNGGQGYPSFRVPGTVAIIETAADGTFTVHIEEFAAGR
jgi:hypothetical protein